jgi:hypothetical protein
VKLTEIEMRGGFRVFEISSRRLEASVWRGGGEFIQSVNVNIGEYAFWRFGE